MLQSLDTATWNGAVTIRAAAAVEEVARTVVAARGGRRRLRRLREHPRHAGARGLAHHRGRVRRGGAGRAGPVPGPPRDAVDAGGAARRNDACSRAWSSRSTSASTFSASSPFRSRSASASNTRSTSSTATGRTRPPSRRPCRGRGARSRSARSPPSSATARCCSPATRRCCRSACSPCWARSAAWRWPSWRCPPRWPPRAQAREATKLSTAGRARLACGTGRGG